MFAAQLAGLVQDVTGCCGELTPEVCQPNTSSTNVIDDVINRP